MAGPVRLRRPRLAALVWLYAIATHSCIDAARSRRRRALPVDLGPASPTVVLDAAPRTDVAWLGPHPDEHYEQREAVELAYVAALQHLPPNQRAALLLVEVVGFTVADVADAMATSPVAVASALQRAGAAAGPTVAPTPDPRRRVVAAAFADALERGDADALVALLAADITWSMPPLASWYAGRDDVAAFARAVPFSGSCGAWRTRLTWANSLPAVVCHRSGTSSAFEPWSVTALDVHDGRIRGIVSFLGESHVGLFGSR
ncbi:sigma factor-like helix-turn-helix DNA-binding protein [Pseudonocardia sp. CA-107938]|uniref:sigma factor-like helix-turn-helix DNA-binding protein n=1 Tax=Pseudonocardia sp. CA-107938 TaxID=3240021 RepID=UPI003D8ACB8E